MHNENLYVLSLGGSLIVPDGIDAQFVKDFKALIESHIKRGKKFLIVTGGGKTARSYIEAASRAGDIANEDKDWLGIHATRMNAHFIRTIFREHAHSRINTNPHDLEDFYNFKESVLVAAGWRPGFSTDYDAVVLAKYLDIKKIANLSNIDYVCDKDPKKYSDARIIKEISWEEYCAMVGNKWTPGMNAPFDPIASKLAREEKIEVAIMNGKNLKNLEAYLDGKKIEGTMIR